MQQFTPELQVALEPSGMQLQLLLVQTPLKQVTAQPPQLPGSLVVSTQLPLHTLSPFPQLDAPGWQTLFAHDAEQQSLAAPQTFSEAWQPEPATHIVYASCG